jgi:Deacetylase PdaC/Protein of unknown function (DUF3298)
MKRFGLSLIGSFLAFTAGLVTASSWNATRQVGAEPVVIERCPPGQQPPQVGVSVNAGLTEAPDHEYPFAQGRLKLVPENVRLKSDSLHYDIDVRYPQIVGGDTPGIRRINQQMKALATAKYQWPLNASKDEIRRGQEQLPGTYNSVNLDYEVSVATESFLSIFFTGYSYGVGAAHAVQESESLNYDLASGSRLQLGDLFKSGSRYLEFISEYCIEELSATAGVPARLNKGRLAPSAKNFENWHISSGGISFNFDACEILACTEGDQSVEIPFSDLKSLFAPGIPGKFTITYP